MYLSVVWNVALRKSRCSFLHSTKVQREGTQTSTWKKKKNPNVSAFARKFSALILRILIHASRIWPCGTLNPFIPKSDQYQISPAASPEILHHTVWRTWLFIAYSDARWLYYQLSLPSVIQFSLQGWENAVFELGSERVNAFTPNRDQVQISPAASPVILHHTAWRTWLFIAYSVERQWNDGNVWVTVSSFQGEEGFNFSAWAAAALYKITDGRRNSHECTTVTKVHFSWAGWHGVRPPGGGGGEGVVLPYISRSRVVPPVRVSFSGSSVFRLNNFTFVCLKQGHPRKSPFLRFPSTT